jgi:hypothetical protein
MGNILDIRFNLAGVLVAPKGFPLKSVEHDLVEAHIDLNLRGGRGELPEWQFTGEQLIKNDPERIDVGAVIDFVGLFHLLRSHVVRSAHDILRTGQLQIPGLLT